MSIEVKNCYMFDTVSESYFGPQCLSNQEAWNLVGEIQRTLDKDPRSCDDLEVINCLFDLRAGIEKPTHKNRICDCGSGQEYIYKVYRGEKVVKYCKKCFRSEF